MKHLCMNCGKILESRHDYCCNYPLTIQIGYDRNINIKKSKRILNNEDNNRYQQ